MNVWSLEATCIAHSMRRVLLAARDPDRFLDDKDYYGNKGTLSKLVEMEANTTTARARGTHPEVSGARGTHQEVAADDDDRHTSDDDFIDNTPQKNPDVMRMRPRRSGRK